MPREPITEQILVDEVLADHRRRYNAWRFAGAITGRRQALAALDDDLPVGSRSPHRMLRYLLAVIGMLAVYTGFLYVGWRTPAALVLAGLLLVGGLIAWQEHRSAPQPAPQPEFPQPEGFSDDPAMLEQQLDELRPVAGDFAPGVMPAGPPMYASVCARCGFDPLSGETSGGVAAEDRAAIAVDVRYERTADAAWGPE